MNVSFAIRNYTSIPLPLLVVSIEFSYVVWNCKHKCSFIRYENIHTQHSCLALALCVSFAVSRVIRFSGTMDDIMIMIIFAGLRYSAGPIRFLYCLVYFLFRMLRFGYNNTTVQSTFSVKKVKKTRERKKTQIYIIYGVLLCEQALLGYVLFLSSVFDFMTHIERRQTGSHNFPTERDREQHNSDWLSLFCFLSRVYYFNERFV